jgi:hypothetical protein
LMLVWYNKFCPGFMCVPRKPHPFGTNTIQFVMVSWMVPAIPFFGIQRYNRGMIDLCN